MVFPLGMVSFPLNLEFSQTVSVLCKIWILLSTSGGTDRHVSLLNFRRSDEGPDVPWNGHPAQIILDCLCPMSQHCCMSPRSNGASRRVILSEEVCLEGERKPMLMTGHCGTVPTLRQALSAGQLCAALDHAAKQTMFSCDTELDHWSVLGTFWVNSRSGWGRLPSTSAPSLNVWGFA